MMMCDSKLKCGKDGGVLCVASIPHNCKDHGYYAGCNGSYCSVIELKVRCIPHRNYDADGRAARRECINTVRRYRHYNSHNDFMSGARKMCLAILKAMREARKGAK